VGTLNDGREQDQGPTAGRADPVARPLTLSLLTGRFAICRLAPNHALPEWLQRCSFWSATRSDEELSIVVPQELVPPAWQAEKGWRCLHVLGPLDLNIVGVLASLSGVLAGAGVSIFCLSTYDTDYLFVREPDLELAKAALQEHGYTIH
jgi:hypothetical protein